MLVNNEILQMRIVLYFVACLFLGIIVILDIVRTHKYVACVPPPATPVTPAAEHSVQGRRIAYVFYITPRFSDELMCPLKVVLASLWATSPDPAIDTVLMHVGDAAHMRASFEERVLFHECKHPMTRGLHQWEESYAKLCFSTLMQYERIVYLEADMLVLKNLDHLFDMHAYPVPISCTRAYWLDTPAMQTGGPVVADPRPFFYERHFTKVLDESHALQLTSEMDWVNAEFGSMAPLMHGFYALLVSEFIVGDKVGGYWGRHFNATPAEVLGNAHIVHFIAEHKPWRIERGHISERYAVSTPELHSVLGAWYGIKDRVCTAQPDAYGKS